MRRRLRHDPFRAPSDASVTILCFAYREGRKLPKKAGATITEVARRHDVTRQQIYTWRSELKKKGLLSTSGNAVFIPVGLSAAQADVSEGGEICCGMIELRLSRGRTLRFESSVAPSVLTQVIRAVEAA
ncbi:transposase [Rhizobium leguminosarum]|uniref:Transposase n=2 Tax=Rhizobium leguminosarum TaxID=384 RepID=A0A7K3VWZ1_RHILE|nr:transposase [Rhizobium leguminosarum]